MIALLLLLSCSASSVPEGDHLTESEQALRDDVFYSFVERFPSGGEPCYFSTRVVRPSRQGFLNACFRCPSGECAAGTCESPYGCAAGCTAIRHVESAIGLPWWESRSVPVIYLADNLALRHEFTHAISFCALGSTDPNHEDPLLWGSEGVTPL